MSLKHNYAALVFSLLFVLCSAASAQSDIEEKLTLADKHFDLYGYKLAISTYQEVLKTHPQHVHALTQLGKSYLQMGDASKAISYFDKAAQLPHFDESLPLHFGHALMMHGDYAKAKVWYQMYAETDEKVGAHYAEVAILAGKTASTPSEFEVKSELINTPETDFAPVFYGNKLVYSSMRTDIQAKQQTGYQGADWTGAASSQLFITEVDPKSGYLQKPQLIKGELQTSLNEAPVAFSADGKRVAFCRNNFVNGNRQIAEKGINLSLYTAEIVGDSWTQVRAFPHNGSDFSTGFPAWSSDGKTLYFASNRLGAGQGGWDLYASDWNGTNWSTPTNLGPEVNTPGNEIAPSMDGDQLYFSSDWHAGLGGLDIFSATWRLGGFAEITHLGAPVNSSSDDFGFVFRQNQGVGYFTSSRKGGRGFEDIYKCTRKSNDYLISVQNVNGEALSGAVVDLTECGKSVLTTATDGKLRFAYPTLSQACKGTVTFVGYQTAEFELKPKSTKIFVKMSPVSASTSGNSDGSDAMADASAGLSPMVYSYQKKPSRKDGKSKVEPVAQPKPEPTSDKVAIKADTTAATRVNGFAVQLAAHPESKNTDASVYAKLSKYGNIYEKTIEKKNHIRIGVYENQAKAKEVAALIAKEYKGAFVVEEKNIRPELVFVEQKVNADLAASKPTKVAPATQTPTSTKTAKSVVEPALVITRYAIQLAAFEADGEMFNISDYMQITDLGTIYNVPSKEHTRVRLGVWEDPAKAELALKEVKKRGFKEAIIVNEKSNPSTDKLLIKPDMTVIVPKKTEEPTAAAPITSPVKPVEHQDVKAKGSPKEVSPTKKGAAVKPKVVETPVKVAAGPQYLVRVASLQKIESLNDMYLAGIPAETEVKKSGKFSVVYLKGFSNLEAAIDAKNQLIKRGFKDAYLVKEENGKQTQVKL